MTIKVSEKIQNNLVNLRQQLKILSEESSDKQPVELLAVSKKHSIDAIKAAAEADQINFGENYVQEGVEKIQKIDKSDIEWHMLGAIQSRKCKDIATHFDWVQSVDRTKVINKLNQHLGLRAVRN